MTKTQEVAILLVEDDPGHARLIEKNLRRSNVTNAIHVVNDGRQAIDQLGLFLSVVTAPNGE